MKTMVLEGKVRNCHACCTTTLIMSEVQTPAAICHTYSQRFTSLCDGCHEDIIKANERVFDNHYTLRFVDRQRNC